MFCPLHSKLHPRLVYDTLRTWGRIYSRNNVRTTDTYLEQ